jgi:hypothetical protein
MSVADQQQQNQSLQKIVDRYKRLIEINRQLNSTLDHVSLLKQIVAACI